MVNRHRIEVQIGHSRAELHPDDIDLLLRQLGEAHRKLAAAEPVETLHLRDRLAAHLRALALAGRCCPSNGQLAEQMELTCAAPVTAALAALERGGAILIERGPGTRVVRFPDGYATASAKPARYAAAGAGRARSSGRTA
jgi:hypothetical protein